MEILQNVIESIEPIDYDIMEAAQRRLDSLTKPLGSLGSLEEVAKQLAGITKSTELELTKKAIVVMAADHGVAEEKVSAYPQAVTGQMVDNFIRGGAGINVLARHIEARIILVDMGVACDLEIAPGLLNHKIAHGTNNMTKEPAMTYDQAVRAMETGIHIVENQAQEVGIDILGTGDMGIGNTTASSAIIGAFTGLPIEAITGHGTGIDDDTLQRKIESIRRALELNKPNPHEPIDVLSKVGGFEIGGLTGCILAAANLNIPVVIDGFISSAAALLACRLQPLVKDYIFAGHQSVEVGQTAVLKELGKKPLLDLNMRLGEGTGAALAINLIDASVKIFNEMATFSEAQVSEAVEGLRIES